MLPVLELLILIASLLLIIRKWNLRPPNFPSGLPRVPILGSLPFLGPNLFEVMKRNSHQKIWSFFMGSCPVIVITDYDLFKEAMSDDTFEDRSSLGANDDFFRPDKNGQRKGIMFSNGKIWVEQRRFSHRQMKDFGFGRTGMEPLIVEEAIKMKNVLTKRVGKPTSLKLQLNVSILNALWHILTGETMEYDNPRLNEIIEKFYIMMARSNTVGPASLFPWLKYVIPKQCGYTNTKEANDAVAKIIEDSLDKHLKTYDPGNKRDFTDVYISEMIKQKDNPDSSFNSINGKDNYICVMTNLFVAGSETTSNTINYTLWYLCNYPEVQRKIQEEVDTVIGRDTLPSYEDRSKLPYLEAVVHETQRIVGLAFAGIPRESKRAIKLGGYDIPKGTRLFTDIYQMMHNPDYWQDPHVYRPERFLQDGKFQPDKRFLAFGIGKRDCMGKVLAQMELLLFLSIFLQSFKFSFPADYDPSTFEDEVGFILTCPDYPIVIEER